MFCRMSGMNILAVVMAGGQDMRFSVLSQKRVKAAMPFAGKYRIIDFALSNCTNSGILAIGILVQYQPHSLNSHVRTGQPWDLNRELSGGVTLLQPYQRHSGSLDWYRGTADAVIKIWTLSYATRPTQFWCYRATMYT